MPAGAVRVRLNADETLAYFAVSQQDSSFDLFVARRYSRAVPFTDVTPININNAAWDFSPAAVADGSELYFESQRPGYWEVHRAVRVAGDFEFGPVEPVAGLRATGETANNGGPFVTASGDALYYHRTRSGVTSIARAARNGASFEPPELTRFSILGSQYFPVPSSDELTLYFAVTVPTEPPHTDIWRATRDSTSEPFERPTELTELNTVDSDVPSYVSEDGCRLYFDRVADPPIDWFAPRDAWLAEREPG